MGIDDIMSTSDILHRTAELVRVDGTGRTIHGLAVPYGVDTDILEFGRSYRERFQTGAFQRSIAERGHKVRLLVSHDARTLAIGKATQLEERADGLHVAFHVPETRAGNDALELVRSGVVDQFSVGFVPMRSVQRDGVTVRIEASLREVSLVNFPAYEGTSAGVRSITETPIIPVGVARRRLALKPDWF